MQKLSAVIITLNEINNIKDCIESISFADEIIVVDSYSNDGTWEYLQQLSNVKASQHPFDNYTAQKTHALRKASYNWVLFIDADEIITPLLKKEIHQVLQKPTASAYYIYRNFIMNGHHLKYGGFQTDKQLRLFDKRNTAFIPGKLVHEKLQTTGTEKILKQPLEHHFYKSEEDYRRRIMLYGKLKGTELFQKGLTKPTAFHHYLKPGFKFFHKFIIRFGLLDGKRGYLISKINAKGVAERYKVIDKLRHQKG